MYLILLKISICCVLDLFRKVSRRLRDHPPNRKALQLRAFRAGGLPLTAAVRPQAGPQEGGGPAQAPTPRSWLSDSGVHAPQLRIRHVLPRDLRKLLQILL